MVTWHRKLSVNDNLKKFVENVTTTIIYEAFIDSSTGVKPVDVHFEFNNHTEYLYGLKCYGHPVYGIQCLLVSKTGTFNVNDMVVLVLDWNPCQICECRCSG